MKISIVQASPLLKKDSPEQKLLLRTMRLWGDSIRLCSRLEQKLRYTHDDWDRARITKILERAQVREWRRSRTYHIVNFTVYDAAEREQSE